jgi:predicted DNA-binding transcriptional regulator AlpA
MDVLRDEIVIHFLGPHYVGRRYLTFGELKSLGLVTNRASLRTWIERGVFPAGIKIAGPFGRSLRWRTDEIVKVLAARTAERDAPILSENDQGAPATERPSLFHDPLKPGRDMQGERRCLPPPEG